MNTQQIAFLNTARTADRKSQIATLKLLRSQGIEVLVKLNSSARAIADEVARLLKVVATVVKRAVSKAATDVKATLSYWQARPVKPLNIRAVGGAIALSLKLGF
jgi:hypothetical protein